MVGPFYWYRPAGNMATLPCMHVQTVTFQSERANLKNWRVREADIQSLEAGEVLIRVDHFALTANNITYGVAGDAIGYWQFFPAEVPWGCIPVWGFGEVIASEHPDVPVGERLYGYYPMSTHLVIRPENVSRGGLVDGAAHRSALPPVYNQYTRTAADPAYDAAREAEQMLYRPLFTTSFFLDDFLNDNDFFGAANSVNDVHHFTQDIFDLIGVEGSRQTIFNNPRHPSPFFKFVFLQKCDASFIGPQQYCQKVV